MLLTICISLEKCIFRSSILFFFFNWVVCFILSRICCFYILEMNLLSIASFASIFSHSEDCLYVLFIVFFTVQKLLHLIRSHFIYLFFHYFMRWIIKRSYCNLYWRGVCLCFPLVSGLTFRSLIHFEFIFLCTIRVCSSFTLLHVAVWFSQNHLLKRLSCFHYIVLSPQS